MYSRVTTVCNPTGLHARPATEFVAQAKKYASKITIRNMEEDPDECVNAKSVVLLRFWRIVRGAAWNL